MTRKPKATVDIRQVNIHRDEALIIYFHKGTFDEPELVQFEAHVNGKDEIGLYCNEPLQVRPFSKLSHWVKE